MKFLRYNSRHHLYYHPEYGLRLNPISSMYDGKQKSAHEPLWLYRTRRRLFGFAGQQRCPRRDEGYGFLEKGEVDSWDIGPDGNRTCSYCGSIHYEDLMAICTRTLTDERYGIEGTTKGYKAYIRQPNVRNASEGAIKYYNWHTPKNLSAADRELYEQALLVTSDRFAAKWKAKA